MNIDNTVIIFCDLDGVLVDFEKGVSDLFRKPFEDITKDELWSHAEQIPDFYTNLPWKDDGKRLWEVLKWLNTTILSAAPKDSWAERQKRAWVDRELGQGVKMVVSTRKYKYCSPTKPLTILIDDREIHCRLWEESGGFAILHENTDKTLEQLSKLGIVREAENNHS